MTGEAHWFVPLTVVLCGAIILGAGSLLSRSALFRTKRRRLICPAGHRDVRCEVVQSLRTGEWINVTRCSGLKPPDRVLCAKKCLAQLNHPPN